jgi:hypothetical protein
MVSDDYNYDDDNDGDNNDDDDYDDNDDNDDDDGVDNDDMLIITYWAVPSLTPVLRKAMCK